MTESHKEDGRPAFQFYPKDWLSDTQLAFCSLAAKGLWIDLLSIMWTAPIRGVLCFSPDGICHSKLDGKRLAKILRCHEDAIDEAMQELLDNGVISVDEKGFMYSRRMRRESLLSDLRATAGRKGAEKRWNSPDKMAKGTFAMAKNMANDGPPTAIATATASSTKEYCPEAPKTEASGQQPLLKEDFKPNPKRFYLCHDGPYRVDEADVYLWFPVRGCKDERGWPLFKEHIRFLVNTLGPKENDREFAEFVIRECKSALSWCQSNPRNQKTPLGMAKFLHGWVVRAVNRGAAR